MDRGPSGRPCSSCSRTGSSIFRRRDCTAGRFQSRSRSVPANQRAATEPLSRSKLIGFHFCMLSAIPTTSSSARSAASCSASGRSTFRTTPPSIRSRSRSPAETHRPATPPADCRPTCRRSSDTDPHSGGAGWRLPRSAALRRYTRDAPASSVPRSWPFLVDLNRQLGQV